MEWAFFIISIICAFAVFIIYHKLFNVIYFDLATGCAKEFVICGFIGVGLAWVILKFWYISIIVAILVVIALAKRS